MRSRKILVFDRKSFLEFTENCCLPKSETLPDDCRIYLDVYNRLLVTDSPKLVWNALFDWKRIFIVNEKKAGKGFSP